MVRRLTPGLERSNGPAHTPLQPTSSRGFAQGTSQLNAYSLGSALALSVARNRTSGVTWLEGRKVAHKRLLRRHRHVRSDTRPVQDGGLLSWRPPHGRRVFPPDATSKSLAILAPP